MSSIIVHVLDDKNLYSHTRAGSYDNVFYDIEKNDSEYTLLEPPDKANKWQWKGYKWVLVSNTSIWDSKLEDWVECSLKANEVLKENQKEVWENIKLLRDTKIEGGVYIKSIDKHLHTDSYSLSLFSNIGNNIVLGIFTPLEWKTIEGDFVELNVEVFKEFQIAMSEQTQNIYAKAESHKAVMLMEDNPLAYDYTTGW